MLTLESMNQNGIRKNNLTVVTASVMVLNCPHYKIKDLFLRGRRNTRGIQNEPHSEFKSEKIVPGAPAKDVKQIQTAVMSSSNSHIRRSRISWRNKSTDPDKGWNSWRRRGGHEPVTWHNVVVSQRVSQDRSAPAAWRAFLGVTRKGRNQLKHLQR